MALAFAPTLFSLLTFTAPVAATIGLIVPLPIDAVVVWRAQFTETAAAMLTPPLFSPDSPLDLVLAESVWSLLDGRLPSVLPAVFGLLLVWSLDCVSLLLPLSL